MVKAPGASQVVPDNGVVRTVAMLTDRLAVFLGGRQWVIDSCPSSASKAAYGPSEGAIARTEGIFRRFTSVAADCSAGSVIGCDIDRVLQRPTPARHESRDPSSYP